MRFVEGAGSFYAFSVENITSIRNLREDLYDLEELIKENSPKPKHEKKETRTI